MLSTPPHPPVSSAMLSPPSTPAATFMSSHVLLSLLSVVKPTVLLEDILQKMKELELTNDNMKLRVEKVSLQRKLLNLEVSFINNSEVGIYIYLI